MNFGIESLPSETREEFSRARLCLLPSEIVDFVCRTRDGFLSITDRRVVFIGKDKRNDFEIEWVLPLDSYYTIEETKKDAVEIIGHKIDTFGRRLKSSEKKTDYEFYGLEIRAPKSKRGENKHEVKHRFKSSMDSFETVLIRNREAHSLGRWTTTTDVSYFENLPVSLTRNAVLDLNVILQDRPIHDRLYHEALGYLGQDPFIIEESMRSGNDPENGVLFAAGEKGYIWIQGKKKGHFSSSILVDKMDWENIHCLTYPWQDKSGRFNVIYSLHESTGEIVSQLLWKPTTYEDTTSFQWLLQSHNGPWIFSDLYHKYTDRLLPTSLN